MEDNKIKEKHNIDDISKLIENADTTCPNPTCSGNRYYIKIYCGKVIRWCSDCGWWDEFDINGSPLVDKDIEVENK